jgi:inhibitor of KinA
VTAAPLGDQGVLASCAGEAAALRLAAAARRHAPPWLLDVVQAYTSVAVFFDPDRADCATATAWLAGLQPAPDESDAGRRVVIPCCYDLGPDLAAVAERTGLSGAEVVRLHAATDYTVYAIGFCPGFPYLGYLPGPLCGVPRLASPRLRVEAGSIGLTGRQTGIYTEERPGGWPLVGRTPLTLVDVAAGYFPLRTGDRVRFEPITPTEFEKLRGQRL